MVWSIVAVELTACAWILIMLVADLVVPPSRKASLWVLAFAGTVVCAVFLAATPIPRFGQAFGEMFVQDSFAGFFKGLFLLTTAIVILMTRDFRKYLRPNLGAFYMLLFTALLGMLVLSSINDLLMLFIGLELLTFSLYIMAAYVKTDARSIEAGMKYLILGSVSAGFLVYGIALIYGFAGSTSFPVIRAALATGSVPLSAQAGLLLILAGLGFKVAAVPFHLWVPDVYEGAPSPVVAFMSVGSKMAGVVAILRVFYGVFLPLEAVWAGLLAIIAAVTMCYGNLAAIPQNNIKRLLGYSAIGHAGYLLMGLSTTSSAGAEAVSFYLLAYLFSNLAAFFVVVCASDHIGGDALDSYNGLSRRSPFLAAALFVALMSLAGIPPLAGFFGKLLVFLAAAQSRQIWLVVIGALNVVISLYYYLLIVRRMYILNPAINRPIPLSRITKAAIVTLVLGILLIGIFQEPFLNRIAAALSL